MRKRASELDQAPDEGQASVQAWAKVPRILLADEYLRDHPLHLRVLIALLSYADPRRPHHPVWPGVSRLVADIGLKDCPGNENNVRIAIDNLVAKGYIVRLSAPHRKLRLSLHPILLPLVPASRPPEHNKHLSQVPLPGNAPACGEMPSNKHLPQVLQAGKQAPAARVRQAPAAGVSNHPTTDPTSNIKTSDHQGADMQPPAATIPVGGSFHSSRGGTGANGDHNPSHPPQEGPPTIPSGGPRRLAAIIEVMARGGSRPREVAEREWKDAMIFRGVQYARAQGDQPGVEAGLALLPASLQRMLDQAEVAR